MASRSVNKVILVGHLGRDAETAYTASQIPVTKFSVATSRRWKDQQSGEWKEETNWTNVVLWRGENVAPYLTKASRSMSKAACRRAATTIRKARSVDRRKWSLMK